MSRRAFQPTFRFAPSPTGRLHLGHAYSALLNEAAAKTCGGRLLLRIEDIDAARSRPEHVEGIVRDLAWLGIAFDGPVRRQSEHMADYEAAASALEARGLLYPCFCTRTEIARDAAALAVRRGEVPRDPDGAPHYPGTCRGLSRDGIERWIAEGRRPAMRLDIARAIEEAPELSWERFTLPDPHAEVIAGGEPRSTRDGASFEASLREAPRDEEVRLDRWSDPVLVRRDTPTSYHLAVVVDDALQGVTHVVRGRDLEAATGIHRLLQALFGLPSPLYHHHGLILGEGGEKLAKSAGSPALADLRRSGETPSSVRRGLGFPG